MAALRHCGAARVDILAQKGQLLAHILAARDRSRFCRPFEIKGAAP